MKEKISKIIIVITISLAIAIFISGFIQALSCGTLVCSGNVTINVNNLKPFVSINNPLNINYTSSSILINITATDTEGFLSSIWFYNGTGNQTYTTPISINFSDGSHTMIAYANDTANNVNSTSITFFVDITPPNITLISPANGLSIESETSLLFAFSYNVSDLSSVANCSLIINNETANTSTSITKGTTLSLTKLVGISSYNWHINCTDSLNNIGNSSSRSLTVKAKEAEGCDNACVGGTRRCANSYTAYETCGDYNRDGCTEWSNATACSSGICNSTTGNCASAPCSENWQCSDFSACVNGTKIRTCSDLNNCGTIVNKSALNSSCTCTEDWQCSDFSACVNGTKIRTCSDLNNCGTILSKPALNSSCICTEDWQCSEFSCVNHTQTRKCIDINNCGTVFGKLNETGTTCNNAPLITYTPQNKDMTVYNNSVLDLTIHATDSDNDNLNGIWKLNGNNLKTDNGIGALTSGLTINDLSNYSSLIISFDLSDGLNSQTITWNIKVVPAPKEECIESWTCDWTDCKNDSRRFASNCYDRHECGTSLREPVWQMCECISNWSCGEWGECGITYTTSDLLKIQGAVQGTQQRTCINLNKCDIFNLEKIETQNCTKEVPIKVEETIWCGETYLEVYKKTDNQLVSRIRETTGNAIEATKKIDIEFSLTNLSREDYCWWCFDGRQDYDETGIDCGGSCASCREIRLGFDYATFLKLFLISFTLLSIIYYLFLLAPKKTMKDEKEDRSFMPKKRIPFVAPSGARLSNEERRKIDILKKKILEEKARQDYLQKQEEDKKKWSIKQRNLERERLEELSHLEKEKRKEKITREDKSAIEKLKSGKEQKIIEKNRIIRELESAREKHAQLKKEIIAKPREFENINNELHELKKKINRLESLRDEFK